MENGADPVEVNAYARAAPLGQISAQLLQQRLDMHPRDGGANGILEDPRERLSVPIGEVHSITFRHYWESECSSSPATPGPLPPAFLYLTARLA